MIKNPPELYAKLQKENREAIAYTNLLPLTETKQGWVVPVEQIFNEQTKITPSQFIQKTLEIKWCGCMSTWVASNMKHPGQFALHLRFATTSDTESFKNHYCDNKVTFSHDRKTLILTREQAEITLRNLDITHFNQAKPIAIMQALQNEYRQKTNLMSSIQFFHGERHKDVIKQFIDILSQFHDASNSPFHQSLKNLLQTKGRNSEISELRSEINNLVQNFRTHTPMNHNATAPKIMELILNYQGKNIGALVKSLKELEEKSNATHTPHPDA